MKLCPSFTRFALPLCLSLLAASAEAVEPVSDGSSSLVDDAVNTACNSWTTLGSVTVSIPADSVFHCAVTAAATVRNPVDINSDTGSYRFALYTNAAGPACGSYGSERILEFSQDDPDLDDLDYTPVSTTYWFGNQSGSPTYYWLATKNASSDQAFTVDSNSISVVCTDAPG